MQDINTVPKKMLWYGSKSSDEKTIALSVNDGSTTPVEFDESTNTIKDAHLGSTQQHAFSSPTVLSYWNNIYENARYEGRHRFDPLFQWTSSEEKKLLRKVAHFLEPMVSVL